MQISGRRQPITDDQIDLRHWIRAPLYLNVGTTAWVTVQNSDDRPYREIIISPFDYRLWGDLWRLQAETVDRMGFNADLAEYLAVKNIEIVTSEGSISYAGRRHELTYIISCTNYHTLVDKDSSARIDTEGCKLNDLYTDLSIDFIDDLLFPSGDRPRLKIARMKTYRRLAKDLVTKKFLPPEKVTIGEGGVPLPDHVLSLVRGNTPGNDTSNIQAMPMVDTKNRLVRVLICDSAEDSPFHIQVAVPFDTNAMRSVFSVFREMGHNIIKHQIRPGINRRFDQLTWHHDFPYARMDVTCDAPNGSTADQVGALKKQLDTTLVEFCVDGDELRLPIRVLTTSHEEEIDEPE